MKHYVAINCVELKWASDKNIFSIELKWSIVLILLHFLIICSTEQGQQHWQSHLGAINVWRPGAGNCFVLTIWVIYLTPKWILCYLCVSNTLYWIRCFTGNHTEDFDRLVFCGATFAVVVSIREAQFWMLEVDIYHTPLWHSVRNCSNLCVMKWRHRPIWVETQIWIQTADGYLTYTVLLRALRHLVSIY